MRGKLIIIEGTDGSGKQTQSELLYRNLNEKYKTNVLKISFPNYESDGSTLVKMYLNGEFGKNPEDVNPYVASIFFASDRYASYKTSFGNPYNSSHIIISDRYTTSNIIHQGSKIFDEKQRDEYISWLYDLEYNKMELPKPDIVIFLHVPYEYTQKLIENRDNKIDGSSIKDIHERNEEYFKKTNELSVKIAQKLNWCIIDCVKDGKLKDIQEIQEQILKKVEEIL